MESKSFACHLTSRNKTIKNVNYVKSAIQLSIYKLRYCYDFYFITHKIIIVPTANLVAVCMSFMWISEFLWALIAQYFLIMLSFVVSLYLPIMYLPLTILFRFKNRFPAAYKYNTPTYLLFKIDNQIQEIPTDSQS